MAAVIVVMIDVNQQTVLIMMTNIILIYCIRELKPSEFSLPAVINLTIPLGCA
jgi:hypothetical protein